jgi:hypothetical protein
MLVRVEITLGVWKSHSACLNHTRACWNHTPACCNHTRRVKITLCVLKSHSCVLKSHSVVLKSHSACKNHTRASSNHTRRWHTRIGGISRFFGEFFNFWDIFKYRVNIPIVRYSIVGHHFEIAVQNNIFLKFKIDKIFEIALIRYFPHLIFSLSFLSLLQDFEIFF